MERRANLIGGLHADPCPLGIAGRVYPLRGPRLSRALSFALAANWSAVSPLRSHRAIRSAHFLSVPRVIPLSVPHLPRRRQHAGMIHDGYAHLDLLK
jgi:hypothetical protein